MKVLCAAFLYLCFGSGKTISTKKALLYEKRAHEMLMKLTPVDLLDVYASLKIWILGVDFTSPLSQIANASWQRAEPILFHQQKCSQFYQYNQLEITPNL